jgi:hypothetical protein
MKRYLPYLFIFSLMVLAFFNADAQCAMCQATAETSMDAGSSAAEGINKGVMYLFFMPWIILGTITYFWWRAQKKAQQ